MSVPWIRLSRAALVAFAVSISTISDRSAAQNASGRIEEALQNITILVRSGKVGYATIWDGNKYVQCRRWPDRAMRCEAAGASMQPSLRNVLTGERLNRLSVLGWALDSSFGNYTRTFPADTPTTYIADQIMRTLSESYDANVADLEIGTQWIKDEPCPPRNGPTQNLAGLVNDAPSMQRTAVHACTFKAGLETPHRVASATELITVYGPTVTAEIQRLRINATRHVFAIFSAGIGYVQCSPDSQSSVIYCEAQSEESWEALAVVLTPERVARLHQAGYADPGRAQNYWKNYSFDKNTDAVIASEILTILYDAYGYAGVPKLKISTK